MRHSTNALYERHPKPQLNQRLMREGLKIYHVCSEPLVAEDIALRTGLPLDTVLASIQDLLEKNVLSIHSSTPAPVEVSPTTVFEPAPSPQFSTQPSTQSIANAPEVEAAPRKLSAFKLELFDLLEPKLGRRANAHLDTLEDAQDIAELESAARRLALKLKLTVDKRTAEALEYQISNMFGKS